MSTLIYITYFIHLLWLWCSLTYVAYVFIRNNEGGNKNIYLKGYRLGLVFFTIGSWFYFILAEGVMFYNIYGNYDYTAKLIRELFNLASTIMCSLLLLGVGLPKQK